MLENEVFDKQRKKFLVKNRKQMQELKKIFDWVEEITIKLRLNIITTENLQNEGDIQYLNQLIRYEALMSLVEDIIDGVLGIEDKDMDILDKLKEFKVGLQLD